MGNGNRGRWVWGGDGGVGVGVEDESRLDCDVGLGLNMQHTDSESHPCTKTNTVMPHPSPYYNHNHNHNHHHHYESSSSSSGGIGGDFLQGYGNTATTSTTSLLYGNPAATTNQMAYGISFKSATGEGTGGVMAAASGKVLFTATQWQELERQTMIYKYIMASIPVPPQLLLPLSTQSNRVGVDIRYSTGSDPEPWRCRRTDGKKWRCSRDVAPDQKYCERHAHKSRPRSRKPVEIQSHNTNAVNNKDNSHPHLPPAYLNTNNSNNILSAATSSYQQPRGTEWFMKSGNIPVSSSNQQFQQTMHSPRVGSKKDHNFQQEEDFTGNYQHESHLNFNHPYSNTSGSTAGEAAASARRQHFVDAWCKGGEGGDNCSLTLSMQSGGKNDINEDHESFQLGVGFLDSDRGVIGGSGDILKSQNQWLNAASWMGSPPGGPLGEALCLGIASTVKGTPNIPSGYSNSTATSCSCEDGGGHGPSFIR